MEAADDIAYCISDIEDGIEKGILTKEVFFQELKEGWNKIRDEDNDPDRFPLGDIMDRDNQALKFNDFKTSYTRQAIVVAKEKFFKCEDNLLEGTHPGLFSDNTSEARAIKCLKNVARKRLFRSPEAENPELAGHKIITGLLDSFKPLLLCSVCDFDLLIQSEKDPTVIYGKDLDLEFRLFNKLPRKYLKVYIDTSKAKEFPEWYLRAHLVVDNIAGMTDKFAMELYQLLNGIRLN